MKFDAGTWEAWGFVEGALTTVAFFGAAAVLVFFMEWVRGE